MLINGVKILKSIIIYVPIWYGITTWISMLFLMHFFMYRTIDTEELWSMIATVICFVGVIVCSFTFINKRQTFFNKPSKIEYTIEILDDNAWKEIGLNYTVKEKLYENKEIYVIEGDYDNANNY